MQPLKTIVVEDEPLARNLLARWLGEMPDIRLLGAAASVNGALELVQSRAPELIFLDINLAGENGFGLLDKLPAEQRPDIIFVTAYADYAVQAFRVNAVDYLKKPFNREHLHEAVRRTRLRHQSSKLNQAGSAPPRLRIKDAGQTEYVEIAAIEWIASASGYSVLHTAQRCYVLRRSLRSLQQRLGESFVRVHRSSIVNIQYVASIKALQHGDALLRLHSGTEIRLSRRYRDALEKLA